MALQRRAPQPVLGEGEVDRYSAPQPVRLRQIELRLGVTNLLNKAPPLTLRDSSGHQVGYDPRYASPMMRTVYVTGSYTF